MTLCRMIYSIFATFALLSFISTSAQALPSVSDASVSFGALAFIPSSNDITITQTSNASIINWSSFSLNSGESLTFQQQTSSDTTLLRLTGSNPLVFSGTLTSLGGLFIVVEQGLAGNMVISAPMLWISNTNISNDDFINGKYASLNTGGSIFTGGGGSIGGSVVLNGGGDIGGNIGSGGGGSGGGGIVIAGAGSSGGGPTNIGVLTVAEPETYALLMSGLALLAAVARRNKTTLAVA